MNIPDDQKLKMIRFMYWLGAVMDGLFAIDMTIITLLGTSTPLLTEFFTHPSLVVDGGLPYRYAIGLGAALMWGWTFLLIWADRKPIERRGILLITFFPVVVGIFLTTIWAILIRMAAPSDFILRLLLMLFVPMPLLLISYYFAQGLKN
ncbi:MAG: hypothetical protein ACFFFH_02975 [Candidatus Thorarchaeota archaeon]